MFLYKNCIYYIWQRAIKRAADESGAFKNVSEDDLAQYVGDTAKLFADQVLAEAQMRNAPIDTVLKASDIVYEDGAIRLAPKKEDGAGGQYEQAGGFGNRCHGQRRHAGGEHFKQFVPVLPGAV